jgi:hypothetical protein
VTPTVRYFDARSERPVERPITAEADLRVAVDAAAELRTGRGTSAVEVHRSDGSSLTFAVDGDRAALVWIDALGHSFHSIGGEPGAPLVYDYFGSWSEVPSEYTVDASLALAALVEFASDGRVDGVAFEPD